MLFDDGLTMDRMFESTSFETCDWGVGIVICVDVLMLCAFGTWNIGVDGLVPVLVEALVQALVHQLIISLWCKYTGKNNENKKTKIIYTEH